MKEIVLVSGGLPHGPLTLGLKSLGGSETAAIQLAIELRKLGHHVTVFCPLPPAGSADHFPTGGICEDGVRWADIQGYRDFVTTAPFDFLIASRVPDMLKIPHQARRAVLWAHDLATEQWTQKFMEAAFNCSEVWSVSEFHRQQIHEVTGYPLDRIHVVRNGIVRFEDELEIERRDDMVFYGSRPERGLGYIVQPGGLAERFPDTEFQFSMYGDPRNVPEHVQRLYAALFQRAEELPNVNFLGSLTQAEVRQKLREATALVYPSDFEETSCIIAREAMEAGCPIIGCNVGALPETMGNEPVNRVGVLTAPPRGFDKHEDFLDSFEIVMRSILMGESLNDMSAAGQARDDLYWDGSAWMAHERIMVCEDRNDLAVAMALVDAGDVVPAFNLLLDTNVHQAEKDFLHELEGLYPMLSDPTHDMGEMYDQFYGHRELTYGNLAGQPRFEYLCQQIKEWDLPEGSTILDYGCCEGNQALNLADRFPKIKVIGFDHSDVLISRALHHMGESKPENLDLIDDLRKLEELVDVVMLTEVLEHTVAPWELIEEVEVMVVAKGGRIFVTTPTGPWEAQRIYTNPVQHRQREHLWHLDKGKMRAMCDDKAGFEMQSLFHSYAPCGTALGNLACSWINEKRPTSSLDPYDWQLPPRQQVVGAAIICMNDEHDILRMLKSVAKQGVRLFSLAMGPSDDGTLDQIRIFESTHPWCKVMITDVPRIKSKEFGFDQARNASAEPLEGLVDWILWIDCDEEITGSFHYMTRDNAFDAYAIAQHHFSASPRGAPPQVDSPARLFRTGRGFKCIGHIHEHFEIEMNKGPGFCMPLNDCDIMHTGYKTEEVRRRRFHRNLPFLMWDMEDNPDRNLNKFLWLRDLVHQMRYADAEGRQDQAAEFAQLAIKHYDDTWEAMVHFGNGLIQGFQYVSEARKYLGHGFEVKAVVAVEGGKKVELHGQIDDPEQLLRVLKRPLESEVDRIKSRYR